MIICQFCAATNPPDAEVCHACGQRLLIVSGEVSEDEQIAFEGGAEEQMSFDEHLLERISVLEEAVKQTARASQTILGMLHDLEQKSLVGQTGVAALRDLLERKALVTRDEWSELWESRMDRQLLALEKRQRFAAARGAMLDLSSAEPRDAFAALLDEAHRQLVDLDVDGALRTLDGAFRLDPDNPELAFFLGETAFNRERGAAAVEYFSRVLKTRPEHYESLIYSGVLLHEAGDDAIAEARLLDAVDRYPDEALPAFALGGLYVGRGRPVDAVDHLERAMGAMGSVPQAALLLADCQLRLERPRLAAAAARAAVAHDPSDVEAHLLFAAAALELSWWRKASDALSTAQHLRPARLSYRALLALAGPEIARSQAEVVAAAEAFERGDGRRGLELHRAALRAEPAAVWPRVALAIASLELDRAEDVEALLGPVDDDLTPGRLRAVVWSVRLEALRARSRADDGTRLAEGLLAQAVAPIERRVVAAEAAWHRADLGIELDRAEVSLATARGGGGDSVRDDVNWLVDVAEGRLRRRQGRLEEAAGAFARAAAARPSEQVWLQLAEARLAADDGDGALVAMRRVRAIDESDGPSTRRVAYALREGARRLHDPAAFLDY